MIDASSQRLLIEVAATWVLFSVFLLSAVAFVGVLFGWLKPDPATRNYLFALFSVSAVGIIVAAANDFLRPDPQTAAADLQVSAERQASVALTQNTPAADGADKLITVYTQIGDAADKGKFASLKNSLAGSRFLLPGVENVNRTIGANKILYCNPANQTDADDLKSTLDAKGFNQFAIQQINNCDREKNRNIVEVWLQTGS